MDYYNIGSILSLNIMNKVILLLLLKFAIFYSNYLHYKNHYNLLQMQLKDTSAKLDNDKINSKSGLTLPS